MIGQTSVVEAPVQEYTTELSAKLQQLRRLRVQSGALHASHHMNAALRAAKREPANMNSEVSYIFIGIEIPTSN